MNEQDKSSEHGRQGVPEPTPVERPVPIREKREPGERADRPIEHGRPVPPKPREEGGGNSSDPGKSD